MATLLFEDNFEGTVLDPAKWQRCPEQVRCDGTSYWSDSMSCLSGDGRLLLKAEWDAENERINTGAVRTKGLFEAGFGYYEASIRFPVVTGVWGAFWLMAGDVDKVDGTSTTGVEIDILESIHSERGQWNQALHWDGYGDKAQTDSNITTTGVDIYDGKFHTFAVWRRETDYIFYIDDREVWRSAGKGACPLDGYIKLTVESAKWPGGGSEECLKALPAAMEIDFVRVWTENPHQA